MGGAGDVIVVGGGIVGVAIAGELARRGARVTVLDARDVGRGATQASAGMLAPFKETTLGTVLGDLCAEGLELYDDAVRRARRDSDVDFEYARTGMLEVALDPDTAARFAQAADDLRRRDVDVELLERPALLACDAAVTPAACAGLLIAPHGFVAVTAFTHALAAAARRYGAEIVSGAAVSRIATHAGALVVSTPRGDFHAAHVVVAAGSWSGQIAIEGDHAPRVHPVRGQLLELAAPDAALARIVWGPHCYLVPWRTGAVLVGATVEDAGFEERITADGVHALLGAAVDLVPALAHATFVSARVGLRPATADGLPILGAAGLPGLIFATGHYRNGVLLAPLTGRIVADLVCDGRRHPALDALAPARAPVAAQP